MKRSRFSWMQMGFGDFVNGVQSRIDSQRISKVEFVRNVGSGPIGPFMSADELVALIPSMHGQRIGRLATVLAAAFLTISTTGVTPEFAGHSETAPVQNAVNVSHVSTLELLHH